MTTKNLPAKLLLALGLIAGAGAMCTGTMLPLANAPALDPRTYVEADATATAIAPALYPTVRYNEEVLPELQAVEREEIAETTRNKQHWKRTTDKAQGVASVAMVGAFALGVVGVSVGASIWIGGNMSAWGIKAVKQARLPMTRLLTEGPQVTEFGTGWHTVTGAVVALDRPQDAQPEHGRLIAPAYAATPDAAVMLGRLLESQRNAWQEEQRLLTD